MTNPWQQLSQNLKYQLTILKHKLQEKIESITEGALPLYLKSMFSDLASANLQNAQILYNFLLTGHIEQNLALRTSLNHMQILCYFNRYLAYKSFERITKDDVLNYLASLRRPETDDPTHKWIGTFNVRQMILNKFFRWLYNQNEGDNKKWITPPCMQGIRQLSKKEKSPYKPSDIEFKMSSNGQQYAEVHIKISKTKPRTLPLIYSIPYVKDWIDSHPMTGNPDSYLFVSISNRKYGKKLSGNALYKHYVYDLRNYFDKLSKDTSTPESDRAYIKNMLTKPWNPYVYRHSGLTEKSQILKESMLRSYAGWSNNSNMPNVYIHYFGNESSRSLLEYYGVENYQREEIGALRGKQCPNCNESNKPDSKFCAKCRMILTYDAYNETMEEKQRTDAEVFLWKNKYLQDVTKLIDQMKDMKELQEETRRELGEIKRFRASLIHS
jgi:hypothetical protein